MKHLKPWRRCLAGLLSASIVATSLFGASAPVFAESAETEAVFSETESKEQAEIEGSEILPEQPEEAVSEVPDSSEFLGGG